MYLWAVSSRFRRFCVAGTPHSLPITILLAVTAVWSLFRFAYLSISKLIYFRLNLISLCMLRSVFIHFLYLFDIKLSDAIFSSFTLHLINHYPKFYTLRIKNQPIHFIDSPNYIICFLFYVSSFIIFFWIQGKDIIRVIN